MKKIIVIALIFASACKQKTKDPVEQITKNAIHVSYSEPSKTENFTNEDLKFMKEHGLTSSITFIENIRLYDTDLSKKYLAKYGIRFMSTEAMKKFYTEKGLIVGRLTDYKYSIPAVSLKEFRENYERLCKSVDFEDYYFIRVARQKGGRFLQRIDPSVIVNPELVTIGMDIITGQENSEQVSLKGDLLVKYSKQYGVLEEDITIGRHGLPLRIMAQKEYFDLIGKEIRDNQIVSKDPAILAYTGEGWLILTTW